MIKLIVTVRSVDEVDAAIRGGADIIDIKEPARGSLGRADAAVIQAVLEQVGDRVPVSAALGELLEEQQPIHGGLSFVKWGLAGCANVEEWPTKLAMASREREPEVSNEKGWHALRLCEGRGDPGGSDSWFPRPSKTQGVPPVGCLAMVVAAYADHSVASSPRPEEVIEAASHLGFFGILFDTHAKTGSTLLDHINTVELAAQIARCRAANLMVVLAGSLTAELIPQLAALKPDGIAVRSGVCTGGRNGIVDENKVRDFATRIRAAGR